MPEFDTIAAVATPPGEGAIGIVRVSGPDCPRIAARLFVPAGSQKDLRSHYLHYGHVMDPRNGEYVDEVLLALMKGPKTYTREDVLEIQCHGGPAVLERLLELIFAEGARPAEPGEFTKRAFLNGRIDLARAEAVIDVVQARTREALAVTSRHLQGELSERLQRLGNVFVDLLAQTEVAIDFPDEDVDILKPEEAVHELEFSVLPQLRRLVDSFHTGRIFREGVHVVIAGRPNVGKSSLMNRLLGHKRAIVTPYPGTTRDSIEETVNIGGVAVRLTDTAGLRSTQDEIERISLEATFQRISEADLVLFLVDYSMDPGAEDDAVFQQVRGRKVLLAANKVDLWEGRSIRPLETRFPGVPMVAVSALTGAGMDSLKETLRRCFLIEGIQPGAEVLLTKTRHKEALERCMVHVNRAVSTLKTLDTLDTLAADLRWALDAVEELTGRTTTEDVLDRIFSRFCIGK